MSECSRGAATSDLQSRNPSVAVSLQVQVDEYKQLKESLNAASNLRQHQPSAPPHLPVALSHVQKNPELDLLHKDEPEHHLDHAKSRVTGGLCSSCC